MKNKRILIVEDEVILAENHKDKLISFGIDKILLAKSKEEAITLLSLHNFDLILLDVRLEKGFEGIELGEYIQDKYATSFIYLTAHSDKSTIEKMLRSKPYGYLSKPVRKSDLFALVSLVFDNVEEDFVTITEAGTTYKFNKETILFAQSSGNYMLIHFNNKEKPFLHRSNVEQLLNVLSDGFIKINRSTIVNKNHVENFNKKELTIGNQQFKISKDLFGDVEIELNR
ncbi:MAG: response regulator transcription factor [Bacteroidetes bacterium]|nr:response regulator transcription factor [Bacteroidota bacterium]